MNQTPLIRIIFLILTFCLSNTIQTHAQLWDDYDGIDNLTYYAEDENYWIISNGVFEAQTGGSSSPDHSYASYDMSTKIPSWNLSKANINEWIGWMYIDRDISGWGLSNSSCCMVLAANSPDFNNDLCAGYALGFKNGTTTNPDYLTLFKFTSGIQGGAAALPEGSVEILETTYSYSESDGGINIYVKIESDGKWTIKWKLGQSLSETDAINASNYSDGNLITTESDETYLGSDFKYVGWVFAHGTASNVCKFDNLGFSQNGALPVELTFFTAQTLDDSILLRWETATEVNNYGFEVQRASSSLSTCTPSEAEGWEILAYIPGHGNSNSPKYYQYIDHTTYSAGTYYYRLKQIDYDGAYEYSEQIPVYVEPSQKIILCNNYPNPFNSQTTIFVELPIDSKINLCIYNILGEHIATLTDDHYIAGKYKFNFDAETIPSGVYFYRLTSVDKILTRKMLLTR